MAVQTRPAAEINSRIVGRLSTYRRLLEAAGEKGKQRIYSYELARLAGYTPAQVRRDIMTIGFSGSPAKGYDVRGLLDCVIGLLNRPNGNRYALVGLGQLGRALIAHLDATSTNVRIVAGFDDDPEKLVPLHDGCALHPFSEVGRVIREMQLRLAILAVPAESAQSVADHLAEAGIQGMLNFSPARVTVPLGVHLENVDIVVALERVAFFAGAARA